MPGQVIKYTHTSQARGIITIQVPLTTSRRNIIAIIRARIAAIWATWLAKAAGSSPTWGPRTGPLHSLGRIIRWHRMAQTAYSLWIFKISSSREVLRGFWICQYLMKPQILLMKEEISIRAAQTSYWCPLLAHINSSCKARPSSHRAALRK